MTFEQVKKKFADVGYVLERDGRKYQLWSNECNRGIETECLTLVEVLTYFHESKMAFVSERIASLCSENGIYTSDLQLCVKDMQVNLSRGKYSHLPHRFTRRFE